jgi:glycosyltransferase involved in cell wall biosynthesis
VVYAQGDVFQRSRGRYRIGYTMLEVDGFPSEWVAQANSLDEVWVPSTFNREAFLRCGLERPIRVMPLGVDTDHFNPAIRAHRNPSGDFVFLANFEWGERKAPELLLRVFNRTFRHREPVVLLCKTINRDSSLDLRGRVRALRLRDSGGRIGFIHNRVVPYSEMGSLYRSADCYVAASRGEGWDMPLLEAMACGLPAIVTDWGAHRDFATEDNCYPLRLRGTVPVGETRCPYYAGFSWADPDPDHLGQLLRHVFENRDEAVAKGARAAQTAREHTWAAAAQRVRERLEQIGAN